MEVGPMALALERPHLNSDGKPHPRENALALSALVLGVLSFALAIPAGEVVPAVHWIGLAIGVVGVGVSMVAQMLSATTGERWTIMPGWICAALGVALNLFFAVS
jgi:hypothetical protein